MLPAVYQKPPQPVVRSRFVKVAEPMMPPMLGPTGLPPGLPPGMGGLPPEMGGMMPPTQMGGPPLPMPPPGVDVSSTPAPGGAPMVPPEAAMIPPDAAQLQLGGGAIPAAPPSGLAPTLPPPMPAMPQPAPGRPPQRDVETAAAIMEKALEIVVDDEHSNEAIKMAIKDVLLPGRGVCRVRWKPQMETAPVMAGDGMTPCPTRRKPGWPCPAGHGG